MKIDDIIRSHPEFQQLSNEAKALVLGRIKSKFSTLSPQAQEIAVQRLSSSIGSEIGPPSPTRLPGAEIGPAPAGNRVLLDLALSGDVKGLVDSPAWPEMGREEKDRLIRAASNRLREKRLEDTTTGTKILGGAATSMMLPAGKIAKAAGRGAKEALVTADEILRFVGGSPIAAISKKFGLDQAAPTVMKMMENPNVQRAVGIYTLSKVLFGGKRVKNVTGRLNEPTSEGLRTEINE